MVRGAFSEVEFPLVTVIVNDSVRREAITHDEKRRFLKFVKDDDHNSRYYDGFIPRMTTK